MWPGATLGLTLLISCVFAGEVEIVSLVQGQIYDHELTS